MARFSDDEIIGRVALHSGLGLDAAARATRGVLQRIASELDAAIRTRLIEELPLRMAAAAAERDVGVAQPIEAHVGVEGLTAGEMREAAVAVCRVLAEAVSASLRDALHAALPAVEALAAISAEPIGPTHEIAHGHTLADGSPGSSRPLSRR